MTVTAAAVRILLECILVYIRTKAKTKMTSLQMGS